MMLRSVQAATKPGTFRRLAAISTIHAIQKQQQGAVTTSLQKQQWGRPSLSLASLSTLSSTTYKTHVPIDDVDGWSAWFGLGTMAAMAAATTTSVDRSSNKASCDEEEEEEDPYDNLPEQDEPTHCSICMTYRQGPCRPYWRKVEACTKDHELPQKEEGDDDTDKDDDDDNSPDPPCLKYMMPWIDCASGFRNLYALIELDANYTEGIADLEESADKTLCWAPGSKAHPSVDWQPWQDYVELLNPDWKLPRSSSTTSSKKKEDSHFWKSLDHSEDPELVQVEATVATSTKDGGILECGYAVDQNGHVIGFVYGTKPGEAAATKGENNTKQAAVNETATMTIRLSPSQTRHVVIGAAYTYVDETKAKKMASSKSDGNMKDDNALLSHIYKSRPFQLDSVANRSTKINIAR